MNKKGFTLIEVMIGMMILTIAIVSTTQVLIGQIRFNQSNVDTLSAYYLAQEGIEGVRNIRDTNWLHNQDWLGEGSFDLWGGQFEFDGSYGIEKKPMTSPASLGTPVPTLAELNTYAPWAITSAPVKIKLIDVDETETKFSREIKILEYSDCPELRKCVLVQSIVSWDDDKQVLLEEVLTNWKNGAI